VSWQMRAMVAGISLVRLVRPVSEARAERRLAAPKSPSHPPSRLTREFDVTRKTVEGFDVYTVSPDGSDHAATVIFLHGGGYVAEIQKEHWALVGEVASELRVDVWVPIYGLAPQHHAEDAIRLMHSVLRAASSSGPVYLMGDSAGAALALAATLTWMEGGGTSPIGLTLIAPWLDIEFRSPDVAAVQPRDPWGAALMLRVCGRAWAGDLSPDDPRVSPVFGDLSSVPPTDVYVGDRDIAMPDCRVLAEKAPPGRVRYHEEPGALHVYPLLPVPEGRAARRDMVARMRSALEGSTP
jgi:acetyl esterase/lipase